MKNLSLSRDYLRLLEEWVPCAVKDIVVCPDRPDLCYYGDGTNGWGVQTNQKALAAFCVLAAHPDLDERHAGLTRQEILSYALGMLRYSLQSHITGDYHTTDADDFHWGHTWISSLGVERMMHGVTAIFDQLTDADRASLRAMLVSESEWLSDEYPVAAGLTKNNRPESNMWNGAVLWRTAAMYPDAPGADAWKEKALSFLANAISVESDEGSDEVVDGRRIGDLFVGANYFDSMACNHHGYMNVGYMVITLSDLAMLHFTMKELGLPVPAMLYRHMDRSWQLVRACCYDDGRLFRIGGDTRVRYCYCQDYFLPVLALAADTGLCASSECAALESRWLDILRAEMKSNGDHSFLSDRCELLKEKSPLYYTRLESDRAVSLSYNCYWHLVHDMEEPAVLPLLPDPSCRRMLTDWHDAYHGSCLVRGTNRFASCTWIASEPPTALCVPPEDSSLAEWQQNMTGSIKGDGFSDWRILKEHVEYSFPGGFSACGRFLTHTGGLIAEQISEEDTAVVDVAFAALPDDATMVTLQRAVAPKRVHLSEVKPLKLNVPNDIFNHHRRGYAIDEETGAVTVDGRLAVAAIDGGDLTVERPAYRQIGIKHADPYYTRGMLHCDEICVSPVLRPTWYAKGDTIFDFTAAVRCLREGDTAGRLAGDATVPLCGDANVRCVLVRGTDKALYLVAANFGDEPGVFRIQTPTPTDVALAPHDCRLYRL